MDLEIAGKRALVTGSTQGIGFAIAKLLAAEGAHVIVNGRRRALVDKAVDALSACGNVQGVVADLSHAEGARELLSAVSAIGPVDILVNNVGYFVVKPFTSFTDDVWLA